MHQPFHFHSLQELDERIADLKLDLKTSDDLSPLFEPATVAGVRLPNRLVVLPMEGCDARPDGSPAELTFRRYRRSQRRDR
jgi:hypothetical protein